MNMKNFGGLPTQNHKTIDINIPSLNSRKE